MSVTHHPVFAVDWSWPFLLYSLVGLMHSSTYYITVTYTPYLHRHKICACLCENVFSWCTSCVMLNSCRPAMTIFCVFLHQSIWSDLFSWANLAGLRALPGETARYAATRGKVLVFMLLLVYLYADTCTCSNIVLLFLQSVGFWQLKLMEIPK